MAWPLNGAPNAHPKAEQRGSKVVGALEVCAKALQKRTGLVGTILCHVPGFAHSFGFSAWRGIFRAQTSMTTLYSRSAACSAPGLAQEPGPSRCPSPPPRRARSLRFFLMGSRSLRFKIRRQRSHKLADNSSRTKRLLAPRLSETWTASFAT